MSAPSSQALADCFNREFAARYRVRCLGGYDEPEFLPANGRQDAQLRYTRDYAASALHEIAHWCIADLVRHRQPDFGYWYVPPPRTRSQQHAFFHAELRVQSVEAVFAFHAGVKFVASVDDVCQAPADSQQFAQQVQARFLRLRAGSGLPPRAERYIRALGRDLNQHG